MNRTELIEALAQHYDGSRSEAAKALHAVVQTISRSTASGEKVAITGFGVFEKVDRPARTVRNPRTGERKEAPATSVPRFRPGTELKAYVAGERPLPADDTPARVPPRRTTPRASAAVQVEPEPLPVAEPRQTKAAGKAEAGKKAVAAKTAAKKADAKKADAKKADAKKADAGKKGSSSKAKKDDKAKKGSKNGKKSR